MRTYCGIGSRNTPADVLEVMEKIARFHAGIGYTLRSGHAPGADQAFERGCEGHAEIFLPWPIFEMEVATNAFFVLDSPHDSEAGSKAMRMAEEFHPNWDVLKEPSRLLMARNCFQVLGKFLNDPVDYVICWTPNASHTGSESWTGGTGQALRIATAHRIKVFNLCDNEDMRLARQVAAL